jgi:hypothetical protein
MPIREARYTASAKWGFKLGVDNTTLIGDPKIAGTLSEAYNTDLINEVLCKKREGYTTVSTWGTRKIRAGFEYVLPSGGFETLVFGQDSTPTGVSGVLGRMSGSATPTTITSGFQDNIKPSILQFGSRVFVFDGANDCIYDGTGTRQIGITAPTVAPAFSANITGSLNTSGSYLYVYTYFNTQTGAESSPSPASDIIAAANNTTPGITISLTPGDASLADQIKIYRTTSSGSVWFLDGTAAISATSYESTISDVSLGTELEQDNTRPEKALIAINSDTRIFIVSQINKSRIHYSKIGLSGPMPESFQAADFVDCGLNDGDEIVALAKCNSTVLVIKNRSCGRLIPIDSQVTGLERFGSTKYLYEEISREVTGLSKDTVIELDTAVVWMGQDDIYLCDGLNVKRAGHRILNTLRTLNTGKKFLYSGINSTHTKQLIWSVCREGKTEPDFQIVGHYQYLPEIAFTFYSPGPDETTHPGIPAGSLFRVTENNRTRIYVGNSKGTGKIYRLADGGNDDTSGIYWWVKTPWFAGEEPSRHKMFHSYYTFASSFGSANILNHVFESDLAPAAQVTHQTTVPGVVAWNSLIEWAEFDWAASVAFSPQRFFPRRRGYWGRYGFGNTQADQGFVVQSVTGIHQIFGRS